MRWADKILLRWRSLFRPRRVEQELDDELQFHLQQQIEENLAAGMKLEDARYAARRHSAATAGRASHAATSPESSRAGNSRRLHGGSERRTDCTAHRRLNNRELNSQTRAKSRFHPLHPKF